MCGGEGIVVRGSGGWRGRHVALVIRIERSVRSLCQLVGSSSSTIEVVGAKFRVFGSTRQIGVTRNLLTTSEPVEFPYRIHSTDYSRGTVRRESYLDETFVPL